MKKLLALISTIIVAVSMSYGQTEIYYDNDTFTGWQQYLSDWPVAVHFSPDGPCEVITMKFYLKYEGDDAGEFWGSLYKWDDTEPDYQAAYSMLSSIETEGWKEDTVRAGYLMYGDFAAGFSTNDSSVHIAIDTGLITGRNWIQDKDQNWSTVDDRTYLIRAVVEYPTGEIEELEGKSITLFPNPAKEAIHISLEDNTGYTMLEIININGQVIYTTSLSGIEKNVILNRESAWENGLYFIRITGQDQVITREIILK